MNELVIRPPVLRLSVLIIRTEIRTWPLSKEWMSGKMTELIKMSGVYSIESLYFRVSTVRGSFRVKGHIGSTVVNEFTFLGTIVYVTWSTASFIGWDLSFFQKSELFSGILTLT